VRGLVRRRFVLSVLLAALVALLAACGGGSGGGDGTDPASVAPASAPLYIGFTLRPEGEEKEDVDALAKTVAGVDSLGGLIVEELEKSAESDGEPFDYAKEVEPWLGEEGGLFLASYAGEDFSEYGIAVQTEDEAAASEFVEKRGEASGSGSYEGVDFTTTDEGRVVGVFDGLVVFAENEKAFKAAVAASSGESLAGKDSFQSATSAAPSGSLADLYVDVGALIKQAGGRIDPEAKLFLETAGIVPEEATALASLIPGSDQVEIDVSTNLNGENPPSGDASKTLGSLPGGALAAFASAEFGKRFNEGIDKIDANGIPGQVPPHKLKETLKEAGIDLESIASSIGDVGVFVEGNTKQNLSGAVVMETKGEKEAANTVSNIGLFLRAAGVPGITAITGKATGFSVHSPELGSQPLVVAAEGNRIAIGYGLAAANAVLSGSGSTLANDPAYKEAVAALGSTPISGFVDGPAALQLASSMISPSEEKFREAKKYLTKIEYVAIGSEASGELSKAKLIVGVGK
jgi:hypothetical protein